MSRNLTARLVMIMASAIAIWVVCGCQTEAPAPITGEVNTADKNAETAKPGGGETIDVNK